MLEQGQKVFWEDQLYLTGYTGAPVRAIFVKARNSKIKNAGIAVQMRNGTWQPKWVNTKNVKPRD